MPGSPDTKRPASPPPAPNDKADVQEIAAEIIKRREEVLKELAKR